MMSEIPADEVKTLEHVARRVDALSSPECPLRLGVDVTLFGRGGIDEQADAVLHFYQRVLRDARAGFRFFTTETMRAPKPITPDVLEMVPFWLRNPNAARIQAILRLTSGQEPYDVAGHTFRLEAGIFDAFALQWIMPWEVLLGEQGEALAACVLELAGNLPLYWGRAGLTMEAHPSRVDTAAYADAARRIAFRHPGVDIGSLSASRAIAQEGIKRVSWITLLSGEWLERVKGASALREALPERVLLHPIGQGMAIQAGPRPSPGDVNEEARLPDLHRVGAALRPIRALGHPPVFAHDAPRDRDWRAQFDEPLEGGLVGSPMA